MMLRRRWSLGLRMAAVSVAVSSFCAPALAQTPAPAVPAAAPAPAGEPAAPTAVVVAQPVQEPAPAVLATLPELPAPSAIEPALLPYADEAPPVEAEAEDWFGAFDVRVFADAYYSLNYNFPKPQSGGNDVTRAYDSANGFSLAWAGLDISHAAEPVGGTLALRFGPSAKRYNSSCLSSKCDESYDLGNVKQAFASWRPGGEGGPVTIDFGKFDTIYGAEVAESQDNINYTRGVLYWLGQPLFHTGLHVNADVGRYLSLRALAVNGWNNTVDNNAGKSFGLQATVHAPRGDGHDFVAASLGYLGGPEQDDYAVISCAPGSKFDSLSASGSRDRGPRRHHDLHGHVDTRLSGEQKPNVAARQSRRSFGPRDISEGRPRAHWDARDHDARCRRLDELAVSEAAASSTRRSFSGFSMRILALGSVHVVSAPHS